MCNFADAPYALAAPAGAALMLHTDWPQFGGDPDDGALLAEDALALPAFSAALLRLA